MAYSNTVEMPSYVIYRDIVPGQPFDPTTPLVFYPENGSDELFDALRAKYPHLKSHSERVGQAVMEYLLKESHLDNQITLPGMAQSNNAFTSPCPTMFQSATSDASTWSSPDAFSLATPSFEGSPRMQPCSRQFSTGTYVTEPSEPSPPALEQMTGVFSLSDANQPKQRIRRKMTEEEKVEYRKRRIIKACEACSKRKRKCHHNQQEMESVANKSQKLARSSGVATSKKTAPDPNLPKTPGPAENVAAMPMEFDDPFRCDLMPQFDDFSNLLETPLPDFNLDDLLAPSQMQQWPWSQGPDFTLMDSSGSNFATRPQSNFSREVGFALKQSPLFAETESTEDEDVNRSMDENRRHNSMIWEHLRTGQQNQTRDESAVFANPTRMDVTAKQLRSYSVAHGLDVKTEIESVVQPTLQDSQQGSRVETCDQSSVSRTIPQTQQSLSLGELDPGILADTDPSTELFMLRRRIPKALHSIVDRNGIDNTSESVMPQHDRLSDHNRRRDHFGRDIDTGLQVLTAVCGILCLLTLLSLLPTHTTNLSLLLLALVSPVRGAKGTHIPRRSCVSEAWGTFLPCSIKNSSWLARIKTQISAYPQDWNDASRCIWSEEADRGLYREWSKWSMKRAKCCDGV